MSVTELLDYIETRAPIFQDQIKALRAHFTAAPVIVPPVIEPAPPVVEQPDTKDSNG